VLLCNFTFRTAQKKVAVPYDKVAVPNDKVAVPNDKVAVPNDKVAVPNDKVAVPNDYLIRQYFAVPQPTAVLITRTAIG